MTPNGPGMQIFSPDGKYGYVCSSFNPETDVITVADHKIVGTVKQDSPFCPEHRGDAGWQAGLVHPEGHRQDPGVQRQAAVQPASRRIDTGPITNHVNFAHNANGTFAYVTIGGPNEVKVFRTDDFAQVATIPVGNLPHGVWPSGDGTRVYVGLENADALAAIDTVTNKVIANIPIGQAPQAIAYVPNAAPNPDDRQNLQSLGVAGQVAHLELAARVRSKATSKAPTSVSLFDQGLIQVLQASVTGLEPKQKYVLALAERADGSGALQPLAAFMTNPAGSAIVDATGPIRQIVRSTDAPERRYLVIAPGDASGFG